MNARISALALLLTAACATSPTPQNEQPIEIQWLGHAAFRIVSSGEHRADFILVTHSHGDHLGDAIALSKMHNAPIVAVNMPALYRRENLPESLIRTVNVGGTVNLGDTVVHVVPAMHGSEPNGRPVPADHVHRGRGARADRARPAGAIHEAG